MQGWSLREFLRAHKRASLFTLAAVVIAVGFIAVSVVIGTQRRPLDDGTPCSDWATASVAQQQAYAQLWLSEYGPQTRAGATPAAVRATITAACTHAALLAEADEVTVYAAIHRRF